MIFIIITLHNNIKYTLQWNKLIILNKQNFNNYVY